MLSDSIFIPLPSIFWPTIILPPVSHMNITNLATFLVISQIPWTAVGASPYSFTNVVFGRMLNADLFKQVTARMRFLLRPNCKRLI